MNSYKTIAYIVGIIAVSVYFLLPEYDKMQSVSASIVEYTDVLNNAASYNTQLSRDIAKINAISAFDLERVTKMVQPDGIHPSQTLYSLELLAQSTGLIVSDISMGELQYPRSDSSEAPATRSTTVTESDFSHQDFDLKLVGTYAQFKQFIEAVEKSVTPLTVVHIKFGSESGETESLSFEVRIRAAALTIN